MFAYPPDSGIWNYIQVDLTSKTIYSISTLSGKSHRLIRRAATRPCSETSSDGCKVISDQNLLDLKSDSMKNFDVDEESKHED